MAPRWALAMRTWFDHPPLEVVPGTPRTTWGVLFLGASDQRAMKASAVPAAIAARIAT